MALLVSVAKWYLNLMPVELPSYYVYRKPLERAEMEYADECGPQGFHSFFRALPLQGKDVLDFGCGYGGRTVRFAESGARSITGIEVSQEMVDEGNEFAASQGHAQIKFVLAGGEDLPFPDKVFDIVCSYDVFEHVADLRRCLKECYRVLRPGGTLYGVFPPFHHPTGGSHLHGYISRSPAPNVFFPCSVIMRAVEQLLRDRGQTYKPPVIRPTDPLWSVNGTTIREFKGILSSIPFQRKQVQLLPMISPARAKWKQWRMKYWAFPFQALVRIPVLNEVMTERIVMELVR
ncbi:MAG: methyltransferase domain-containing protein [Candidatus Korobacteraceae bacterium]